MWCRNEIQISICPAARGEVHMESTSVTFARAGTVVVILVAAAAAIVVVVVVVVVVAVAVVVEVEEVRRRVSK
jgi:hypothetical protein